MKNTDQDQYTNCACSHLKKKSSDLPFETGMENEEREDVRQSDSTVTATVFFIRNMDCPTEEKLIRKKLGNLGGVAGLEFNLIRRELTVMHSLPSVKPIIKALTEIDMKPSAKTTSAECLGDTGTGRQEDTDFRIPAKRWMLLGLAAVLALGSEALAWFGGNENAIPVIFLSFAAILTGGLGTLKKGWIALKNLSLNMNFLMSLAVIGAFAIGQWPEAAVVIVLFSFAEMIEALSLERARNAIAGLMAMAPDVATVKTDTGKWEKIPAEKVGVAALVRVEPGERVPLDGILVEGSTNINQAPITGESMPVAKQADDAVFAGTINESASFVFRVTASRQNSTLSRIVKSVQEAQAQRAPTQRFVDNFARFYIPAIVMLAVLVAAVPPLLFGAPFYPWLYKALVLLVIACPCALVISTPVTIVSALASAARNGVLVKGGVYLEEGRNIAVLALDKTGTLTFGKPTVTDAVFWKKSGGNNDKNALLRAALSLAERSSHPVSRAIKEYLSEKNTGSLSAVSDFSALAGRGVSGRIDGRTVYLGNHRLIHEMGLCSTALEDRLMKLEREGKSVTLLFGSEGADVVFAVSDQVRPTARGAIVDLQRMGVKTVLLTGDNETTARAVAGEMGIGDVRSNLLPEDKLEAVDELAAAYRCVGMVGDGINDAPALAKAGIGFAMGAAGTDMALDTADVVLMDDDLRKIPFFIRLSKKAKSVLSQNIFIALSIKAVFCVLALAGISSLWMAVFADMGASLIVVFNGMRLLNKTQG